MLPQLFGKIVVPSAVAKELSRPETHPQVRELVADPPAWLAVVQPKNTDPALAGFGLGEQEAILLALELGADLVIIDDKAARSAAIDRQLNVIGTLGILGGASDKGLIDLVSAVTKLRDSGFYASDELIDRLLGDH